MLLKLPFPKSALSRGIQAALGPDSALRSSPQPRNPLVLRRLQPFGSFSVSVSQPASFPRKTQLNQDILHNDLKTAQKRAEPSPLPLHTVEVDKMKISAKTPTEASEGSARKGLEWYPSSMKEANRMGKTLMPNKGN